MEQRKRDLALTILDRQDPYLHGTHSLRRTKATLIYRRTGNLLQVESDRFAANVMPVIRSIQAGGTTVLVSIAQAVRSAHGGGAGIARPHKRDHEKSCASGAFVGRKLAYGWREVPLYSFGGRDYPPNLQYHAALCRSPIDGKFHRAQRRENEWKMNDRNMVRLEGEDYHSKPWKACDVLM
jgi:hypothetical protein